MKQSKQPATSNGSAGKTKSAPDNTPAASTGFAALYGEQVAGELELIERVLSETASQKSASLHEGDFDSFCRERQAKLEVHSRQGVDEDFEPVRLLNMLYSGCLRFLEQAAAAFDAGGD